MKNYDKAIEFYQKAVEIDSNRPTSWKWLGLCYMSTNNDKAALECYKKSLELNSDDAQTWVFLCRLLTKNEMYAEALQAYDKAVELAPENKSIREARDKVASQVNKS